MAHQPHVFFRSRGTGMEAVTCLLLLASSPAIGAEIGELRVDDDYVAAGDKLTGKILLDAVGAQQPQPRLRLTLLRQVEVPLKAATSKDSSETLLDRPLTAKDEAGVTFEATTGDMLTGALRLKAELLSGKERVALSTAWSKPVTVGVRRRVSLGGAWDVAKVEPLSYESQWRPKDWKQPDLGKQITLPGALTRDEWFRGWVTLNRQVSWPARDDLAPRVLRISGVANSAKVTVNGKVVGEVLPLDEIEVLTHWVEYHSPYKGEDKKQLRMQMLDVDVQPPLTMPLPPLRAGTATLEMTVRGTHGMFGPKATYGVFGDLHLEMAPAVFITQVTFDTEKVTENRRFKFQVTVNNTTGAAWKGQLHGVYGRYAGEVPYTGTCPAYARGEQPLNLPKGQSTIEVVRDEQPRFDTCRATFVVFDPAGKVVDAEQQDFHTLVMEIRDRRDFYLNNERFLLKGQGSWGEDANSRLQLRLMGANAFRSHRALGSRLYPGMTSAADNIDDRYKDGLLTSAGGALLASVEKCTFYDPQDTSNITRAVKGFVRTMARCPGLIVWEATNELHGEPEEARVAILEAFHKLDPYHRPVLATKGSGEWEAEAREGKVAGVDIVGVQYLLSREAVDSVTSAITEQPIMSTEVNWNDVALHGQNLWHVWLDKGLAGSLLFDYAGNSLQQPVTLVAPADNEPSQLPLIRQSNRQMYQDLVATAEAQPDGRVLLSLGNRMPYALRQPVVHIKQMGRFELGELAPGDAATLLLPANPGAAPKEPVVARVEYVTHGGLKHIAILTPAVTPVAAREGGSSK